MAELNRWIFDSFLKRGQRHIKTGEPCQDSLKITKYKDSFLIAAADGVSQCDHSEIASNAAVESVSEVFSEISSNDELENRLLGEDKNEYENMSSWVKSAIISSFKAKISDNPGSDCTLVFVYASEKTGRGIIGYIGDSCVCVFYSSGGRVYTQSADYGGATDTLGESGSEDIFSFERIDLGDVSGFLVCSDGLSGEIYSKGAHPFLFKKAEEYANTVFMPSGHEHIEIMLESGSYSDDVSLALAMKESVRLEEDLTWLCVCGKRNDFFSNHCDNCRSSFMTLYKDAVSNFSSADEMCRYFMNNPEQEKKYLDNHRHLSDKSPKNRYNSAAAEVAAPGFFQGKANSGPVNSVKTNNSPVQNTNPVQNVQQKYVNPNVQNYSGTNVQSVHPRSVETNVRENMQNSNIEENTSKEKGTMKYLKTILLSATAVILIVSVAAIGIYTVFYQKAASDRMSQMEEEMSCMESRLEALEKATYDEAKAASSNEAEKSDRQDPSQKRDTDDSKQEKATESGETVNQSETEKKDVIDI